MKKRGGEIHQKGEDNRESWPHPTQMPCKHTELSCQTVCMLKDSSLPMLCSSFQCFEKSLVITLFFLILLGWSLLYPISMGTCRDMGWPTAWDVSTSRLFPTRQGASRFHFTTNGNRDKQEIKLEDWNKSNLRNPLALVCIIFKPD